MKKAIVTYLMALLTFHAQAEVFSSSVEGVTIANAHEVSHKAGRILRGSEPKKKLQELLDINVTDVVIFKNDVKGEVKSEIEELKKAGFKSSQIKAIPFLWKDIEDEVQSCEQTLEALNFILEAAQDKDRTVYFHCTAGEDRTGLLAGIVRIASGWSTDKAFKQEMCEHGFAYGNPKKPVPVAKTVQDGLGPVFQKVAQIVHEVGPATNYPVSLCKKKMNKITLESPLAKCQKSSFAK